MVSLQLTFIEAFRFKKLLVSLENILIKAFLFE